MNIKKFIIALSSIALLISCKESFPALELDIPEHLHEVIPQEGESIREPIIPTLSDPQFEFVVTQRHMPATRSNDNEKGVFNDWDSDQKKWMSANFHIFAYEATNIINGSVNGKVDMSDTDDHQDKADALTNDKSHVLLYNRIMRIANAQGDVHLYADEASADSHLSGGSSAASKSDTTFYYRTTRQNTKYNFYTYFAADAAERSGEKIQSTKDSVTQRLRIDGTQDIMHSFAYHTSKKFWEQIDNLIKAGVSQNELKVLCDPANRESLTPPHDNLLYSTIAAHRGFNPIFRINHLMTQFEVKVAGGKGSNDDYKNVIITGVTIEAPTEGDLIIAKSEWDSTLYEKDIAERRVVSWDESTKRHIPLNVHLNPLDSNSLYDRTIYENLPNGFPKIDPVNHTFDIPHYNIKSVEPATLTDPVMLPPRTSYQIKLTGYAINPLGNEKKLNEAKPAMSIGEVLYTIVLGDNQYFEPGSRYLITIYVYGPQQISVKAILQNEWRDVDKPIELGKDSLNLEGNSNQNNNSPITIE